MQNSAILGKAIKSVTVLTGAALLLATLGFFRLTFAETNLQAIGELEDKIAAIAIGMFDEVCITNAYNQARFNSSMAKLAQKKLTLDEYQYFVPGGGRLSELFFGIPILDGNAELFVGRVTYKDRSHNCIVVMKVNEAVAMRHWLNLHLKKYSKNKLQRDKRAPFYFVDQGRNSIMVQITHEQVGGPGRRDFMAYYSYFD
jgi:hypothetical protein